MRTSAYPYGTRTSTRSSIARAALSVKVSARISSGRARRVAMRYAMRRVRTVVLPVPAPATIRRGPWSWVTASTWAGFRPSRIRCAAGSEGSGMKAGVQDEPGRDTCDLSPAARPGQARGPPGGRKSPPAAGRGVVEIGSGLPAVDRREPVAVRRLLSPDHRKVAALDRLGHRARLSAVAERHAIDRHHGRDLPAAAAQECLVRDVELGAIDVALDRRLAELRPEELEEGRPRHGFEDVGGHRRRDRHTVAHEE